MASSTTLPSTTPPSLPPIQPISLLSTGSPNESLVDAVAPVLDGNSSGGPSSPVEPTSSSDHESDYGMPSFPPGLESNLNHPQPQSQSQTQTQTQTLSPNLRIPVPTVSPLADSVSFAYPDPTTPDQDAESGGDGKLGNPSILARPLPPDLAGADITIAPDASYVETSSAPCAIELRKRYDTLYGVSASVRSPYAITAFVGQHGQRRFRVGHRDMSAPGASAAQAEDILRPVSARSPPVSYHGPGAANSNSYSSSSKSKSPQSSKSITSSKSGAGRKSFTKSSGHGNGKGRAKSPPLNLKSPTSSETITPGSHHRERERGRDWESSNGQSSNGHHAQSGSQSYSRASSGNVNSNLNAQPQAKGAKRHSRGRLSINALLGTGSGSGSGNGGGSNNSGSASASGTGTGTGIASSSRSTSTSTFTSTSTANPVPPPPQQQQQPRKLKKPRSNPDLSGYGYGFGYGNGNGYGTGYGSAHGYGYGNGNTTGYGYGYGYGYGNGYTTGAPDPNSNTHPGGRMHSLSVTAADMPRVLGPEFASSSSSSSSGANPGAGAGGGSRSNTNNGSLIGPGSVGVLPGGGGLAGFPGGGGGVGGRKTDAFADMMGWSGFGTGFGFGSTPHSAVSVSSMGSGSLGSFSTSAPSTSYSAHSTSSLFFEPSLQSHSLSHSNANSNANANAKEGANVNSKEGASPSVEFEGAGSAHGHQQHTPTPTPQTTTIYPSFVPRPFGVGVRFDSPAPKTQTQTLSRSGSYSGSGSGSGSDSAGMGTPNGSSMGTGMGMGNGHGLGPRTNNRNLREMQSFESGLTATPMPATVSGASGSTSTSTRLEVDLGGDIDIDLGEVNFGDIVDLALRNGEGGNGSGNGNGSGSGKVLERQRSAIRLSERDKARDEAKEREKEKERERETTVTPSTFSADLEVGPDGDSSASASSSNFEPLSDPSLVVAATTTVPSALAKSDVVAVDGNEEPVTPTQTANSPSSAQSMEGPRVEMYSAPGLPPRLSRFTAYSTDIFDVLQIYRGLPLLDLWDDDSSSPPETIPVKLSLSKDESAAPRDDPRFVIWGEASPLGLGDLNGDSSSVSQDSSTDMSSSGHGPGRSLKGKGRTSDAPSSLSLSTSGSDDGTRTRVLLAATIERWLAQLTSDLDYDELLNFFLTYRTYVSAMDLARLLMARFCWALGTASGTVGAEVQFKGSRASTVDVLHDDVVRRIVRVRTFVAFKYWLITFFTVDFVPNRELRLFVASWLNDLGKELAQLNEDIGKDGVDLAQLGISRSALGDGVSIVKKLKKVARDCKKLYTHNAQDQAKAHSSSKAAEARKSVSVDAPGNVTEPRPSGNGREHLLGEKFAEATRKLSAASAASAPDAEDSDVDLDFISDEPPNSPSFSLYGNSHLSNVHLGGASTLNLSSALSPPGPSSIPLSSFSILQRTDHAPGPEGSFSTGMANNALPIHHNALSRVLVKTLGRLGRWKRVLNSGGPPHAVNLSRPINTSGLGKMYSSTHHGGLSSLGGKMATACADVSAFDVELTVDSSDLLNSSGGVESYLGLIESHQSPPKRVSAMPRASLLSPSRASISLPSAGPSTTVSAAAASEATAQAPASNSAPAPAAPSTPSVAVQEPTTTAKTLSADSELLSPSAASPSTSADPRARQSVAETVSEQDYGVTTDVYSVQDSPVEARSSRFDEQQSIRESISTRRSFQSSSTDSFGEPLSANRASARFPAFRSQWGFDVVSIDELDLSDHSSDDGGPSGGAHAPAAPPGLRRGPKRLPHPPARRDFEFLERPETVSSMGIISRSSIVSASSASGSASAASSVGGLGGNIQQWQMNALKQSLPPDEEPGDVDEALKRLEGQISPQKREEKASKVNGWVRTIRERLAAGDYNSDEEPQYSDEEEDEADDEGPAQAEATSDDQAEDVGMSATTPERTNVDLPDETDPGSAKTPVIPQTNHITSPARSVDAKPAVEDVVPLEIRQSRLSSEIPSSVPDGRSSVASKFVSNPSGGQPKAHRSFIRSFNVEDLAQHFAMIDRELFMTIKFEELLLEDWMYCEEVNALDWAQFLKDRARWKAESRWPEKTSALGAVRARFNLMVNFVISEIVLTNQAERRDVFGWFLWIAWKSYTRNSFNTLVAIITGLRSEWVAKAMRKSIHKLSAREDRLWSDLKAFTSSEDNFKYIRSAVDAINDAKPLETSSHAPSVVGGSGGGADGRGKSAADKTASSACVPFIGIYLSQLYQYNQLPVLIDPTAPNEVVTFDPVSGNLSSPAHPEVFSTLAPLPSSMHLEPLINVQRQRLIAGVIKSLVAGQHLASRVQFPVDKKLFHKCLRIRGLDSHTLQRALTALPE